LIRFVALAILAFPAPVALVTVLTRNLDIGWWPMNVIITAAFYIPICFAIISRLPWNQTLYKLRLASYRATKPQCNPMTLTIDTSGVTLESEQSRNLYKWAMFERVVWFGKSGIGIQYANALNGIAVMRAYFRIFTGTKHPTTIPMRSQFEERFAIVGLSLLILAGGLYPQPEVESSYQAALHLLEDYHRAGDHGLKKEGSAIGPAAEASPADASPVRRVH
jgi:hypothetical protein